MARNITVELLSGKVCTLAVRPEMTIAELTEEMKVESGQHVPNNNDVKLVQWKSRSCDLEQNTKGYQKDHGLFAVQGPFEWVSSPHFLPMILPDSSTATTKEAFQKHRLVAKHLYLCENMPFISC